MKWFLVDDDYIKYLSIYDDKIQYNIHQNTIKPFIGIIISINNIDYYVQISSVKNKHYSMSDKMIDLHKIKNHDKILSVLNINNMIPVPSTSIKVLDYKKINQYRTFQTTQDERKYISLLSQELSQINKEKIDIKEKAEKCYINKLNNPESKIALRSCNFKLLEYRCKIYEAAVQLHPDELPSTTIKKLAQSQFSKEDMKEIINVSTLEPQHKKMLCIQSEKYFDAGSLAMKFLK